MTSHWPCFTIWHTSSNQYPGTQIYIPVAKCWKVPATLTWLNNQYVSRKLGDCWLRCSLKLIHTFWSGGVPGTSVIALHCWVLNCWIHFYLASGSFARNPGTTSVLRFGSAVVTRDATKTWGQQKKLALLVRNGSVSWMLKVNAQIWSVLIWNGILQAFE